LGKILSPLKKRKIDDRERKIVSLVVNDALVTFIFEQLTLQWPKEKGQKGKQ
jgi:hypothetical protein